MHKTPYQLRFIVTSFPPWFSSFVFERPLILSKFVKNSEKKWGAPVELQMAIIQRESDFDWLAAPEWDKLFKVIPYKRKSSAFGYSQAINKTWDQFVRETNQPLALRISFNDSVDFIGWYINKSSQLLKIPKDDYFINSCSIQKLNAFNELRQQVEVAESKCLG